MKNNYKAFLMANAIMLGLPLTTYSSPIIESRDFLKKQHSIRSLICPFEKGVLRYKAALKQLTEKSSNEKGKNGGKESESSDEHEYPQNHLNALNHLRAAAQSFEDQFFTAGAIDDIKFEAIYLSEKGSTLFYYGHALQRIEILSKEKEEKMACLNKLFDVTVKLSKNKKIYLQAPSLEDGKGTNCTMFSSLGYADRGEALELSVDIDQMFLKDPHFMLFTIDFHRKIVEKFPDDFEEFFISLLAEWEPKFKISTRKKLDQIG